MHETDADLAELQSLLDRSRAASGPHLRSAFGQETPISAEELVAALPGIVEVHLAALSGSGAPLVAPVDAIFYRSQLWFGLPEASLRTGLLRSDPRVSASFNERGFAFIVHGTFVEVSRDEADGFRAVARSLYVAQLGDWFGDYFDAKQAESTNDLTGFIEPRVMFAKR